MNARLPADAGAPTSALRTAAVVAGTVLLLDTLRVWLPSIIFVYGRAGTTPATEMGTFALAPFVLAFGAAAAVRFLPARLVAAVAATGLVTARLLLQGTQGGDPQLWLSTAGVLAALLWLVAVAGGGTGGRAAAVGLVGGLAVDATLHALLRSTGLAWREGPLPWLVLLAAAAVLLAGAWARAPRAPGRAAGTARGWLVVGPLLVLHGIVGAVVSRLHTVTGWPEPAAAAVVVAVHAIGAAAGWWVARSGHGRAAGRAGAAVVLAGVGAALAGPPGPGATGVAVVVLTAAGHAVLPVGTALVIAGLVGAPGSAGAGRRAAGCAAGLLAFLALAFGYYAAYDMLLPFGNAALLWVAVGIVALVAVAARPTVDQPAVGSGRPALAGIAAGVAAGLVAAAVVAVATRPAVAVAADGLPVRVMTYNLQMGFDVDGRHSVDRLAAVIVDEGAVVVGVQEVSRGWLINSATDVLPRLAEQVGMTYAFTPAADPVWGNAILSRHPLEVVEEVILPQGRAPMQRSAQAAVVDLGEGAELGVINTHLAHRAEDALVRSEQVAVLDDMARRLAAGGRPVVVLGDLNAEPGSPDLAPLEAWLGHAWDERPAGTWPSWGPLQLIDHILLSDGLSARGYRVGDATASDHLPAAATLDGAP